MAAQLPNVFDHPRVRQEPWRPGPIGTLWLLELLGRSDRSAAWLVAENGTEARYVLFAPAAPFWPAEAITRWAARVSATAPLRHAGLARSVRAGHHGGRPFLLYDLAEWRPLAEHVYRAATLPGDVLALAAVCSEALSTLHGAGLVHGDIQPWSLLVSPDGRRCVLAGAGVAAVPAATPPEAGASAPGPADFAEELMALSRTLDACFSRVPTTATALGPLAESLSLARLVWPDPPAPDAPEGPPTARHISARLLSQRDRCAADGTAFLDTLAARMSAQGVLPVAIDPDADDDAMARLLDARLDEAAALVAEDISLVLAVLAQARERLAGTGHEPDDRAIPSLPDAIALLGIDRVLDTARALRLAGEPSLGPAPLLAELRERSRRAAAAAAHLRLPGSPEHLARLSAVLQGLGRQVVAFHAPQTADLVDRRTAALLDGQPADRVAPGAAERSAVVAVTGTDFERVTALALRLAGAPTGLLQLALRWNNEEPARWRGTTQVTSLGGSLANDLADLAHPRRAAARLDDDQIDALAWKYMALLDEHSVPAQVLLREAFDLCRGAVPAPREPAPE